MTAPLQSGSDSFLDVIANLVGILVILVVATALRVSQTPLDELPDEDEAVSDVATAPAEPVVPDVPEPVVVLPPAPTASKVPTIDEVPIVVYFAADPPATPIVLPEPQPDAGLQAELATLRGQLDAVPAPNDSQPHRVRLAALRATVAESFEPPRPATGSNLVGEMTQLRAKLDESLEAVERARVRLASVELAEDEPESLVHEIRPLGRRASLQEQRVYVRLRGGRAAIVPVDELGEFAGRSMRARVRTGWNGTTLSGTVGPIAGFEMRYVLERGGSSAFDALVAAQRVPRQTYFVDSAGDVGQPLARLLERDSDFRRAILQPGVVLVAAVYPDSFAEARQLSDFAQKTGREIALRPQIASIPIVLSSDGSAPVVQ